MTDSLRLNDVTVPYVNSRLGAGAEQSDAAKLTANAELSFQGSIALGMGFTLTPEERDHLIAKDPRNAERIFPFLGGKEVNTSPTQSFHRYVINFGQMSLEEAEAWPDLIAIVREKVKPERLRLPPKNAWNKDVACRWWQFGAGRLGLYAAIAPLKRCLVTARVTKHLCFSFQPTNRILNEKIVAFPSEHFTLFAILQSRLHEPWVRLLSSTLKTDLNYSASDCFETFPFPDVDPRAVFAQLEAIGEELYETRARYMTEREVGLTTTYNRLKDPSWDEADIRKLRTLHEAVDKAVLDEYGWGDLRVPPYCSEPSRAFEAEIVERLYALNRTRTGNMQSPMRPKTRKNSPVRSSSPGTYTRNEAVLL